MIIDDTYSSSSCTVKNGLFGKKFVDKYTNKVIKMPKHSVVKYKVTDSGVVLYANNEQLTYLKFDTLWFEVRDHNIMYASNSQGKMKIDCLTGKHTPICNEIRYYSTDAKYCVDTNNNILKLNDDCTTEETGLVIVKESKYQNEHVICLNENGKYVVLDSDTLQPIINKEFDDDSIEFHHEIHDNLVIFSDKNTHYIIKLPNQLVTTVICDDIRSECNYETGIKTVKCYDKNTNKTKIIKLDEENKVFNTFEVDNFVTDTYAFKAKEYYITTDKNEKIGVTDKNNKKIIPNKYENLSIQTVNQDKLICAEVDGKKGVYTLDGKNILPCEYKNIDFEESYKYEDKFKFLAQNDKDLYGVVNSNGKVEVEFKYELYTISKFYNNFIDKNSKEQKVQVGLKLKNTTNGNTDFYVRNTENPIVKAEDAVLQKSKANRYGNSRSTRQTITIEEPKYTDGEILMQGVINGMVIDNVAAGMYLTDLAMRDQTVTREIEIDDYQR